MNPGNSTARARRVELVHLGLVEPCATRENHTVWAVTVDGRRALGDENPGAELTRRWLEYRRSRRDYPSSLEVLADLVSALDAQPRLFDLDLVDSALERARLLIGSRAPSTSRMPHGEEL